MYTLHRAIFHHCHTYLLSHLHASNSMPLGKHLSSLWAEQATCTTRSLNLPPSRGRVAKHAIARSFASLARSYACVMYPASAAVSGKPSRVAIRRRHHPSLRERGEQRALVIKRWASRFTSITERDSHSIYRGAAISTHRRWRRKEVS